MRILVGILLTLAVLALGGVAYIYSGFYNVAASEPHSALGRWVFTTTMENSVRAHAEEIDVPDLTDRAMIRQGAQAYQAMCTSCHLRPGLEGTPVRKGLKPTPPVLAEGNRWPPGEQFWIVKHGIKMTGMPAWGETHGDQALWRIVAFLQVLPELSEQEYMAYIESDAASSAGHQGGGHAHAHGSTSHATSHQDIGPPTSPQPASDTGGPSSAMTQSASPDEAAPQEPAGHQDDGHEHDH